MMPKGPTVFVYANVTSADCSRVSITDNLKAKVTKQELINIAVNKVTAVRMVVPSRLFEMHHTVQVIKERLFKPLLPNLHFWGQNIQTEKVFSERRLIACPTHFDKLDGKSLHDVVCHFRPGTTNKKNSLLLCKPFDDFRTPSIITRGFAASLRETHSINASTVRFDNTSKFTLTFVTKAMSKLCFADAQFTIVLLLNLEGNDLGSHWATSLAGARLKRSGRSSSRGMPVASSRGTMR
ncbi:phage-encoded protein-like protein [Acetobacter orientalis]|uniref:Phage-encoded protein-like protein n=1 Tax=Acetobacter orientalis TaxID=146474 RepID=A0A2Z5ZLF3_9PROT|nr:phage-encoded protein-like protein [Acetobacter orientalis]